MNIIARSLRISCRTDSASRIRLSGTVRLRVGLGAREELRHQHPRDTVVAAADGIAEKMDETLRRQEIAGLRIRLARAPGEGGPILGQRDVDLSFNARRAGQGPSSSTDVPYRPLSAADLPGVQFVRPTLHSGDRKKEGVPGKPKVQ